MYIYYVYIDVDIDIEKPEHRCGMCDLPGLEPYECWDECQASHTIVGKVTLHQGVDLSDNGCRQGCPSTPRSSDLEGNVTTFALKLIAWRQVDV